MARVLAIPTVYLGKVRVGTESQIDLRVKVQCPHCKVTRNRGFNVSSLETADFGDAEPYAYLGAWLQHGPGLNRVEHKKIDPTPFEVREFARQHRWYIDGKWVPSSTA